MQAPIAIFRLTFNRNGLYSAGIKKSSIEESRVKKYSLKATGYRRKRYGVYTQRCRLPKHFKCGKEILVIFNV